MISNDPKRGFTAVEVMIALIIASIFLFAGYQLFYIVYQSQLFARTRAEAANIAYAHLRERANEQYFCGKTNPPSRKEHTPHSNENLPNLKIVSVVTCPYGNAEKLIKVEVTVEYTINGSSQKEVQTIYVDKT